MRGRRSRNSSLGGAGQAESPHRLPLNFAQGLKGGFRTQRKFDEAGILPPQPTTLAALPPTAGKLPCVGSQRQNPGEVAVQVEREPVVGRADHDLVDQAAQDVRCLELGLLSQERLRQSRDLLAVERRHSRVQDRRWGGVVLQSSVDLAEQYVELCPKFTCAALGNASRLRDRLMKMEIGAVAGLPLKAYHRQLYRLGEWTFRRHAREAVEVKDGWDMVQDRA